VKAALTNVMLLQIFVQVFCSELSKLSKSDAYHSKCLNIFDLSPDFSM